MPAHILTDKKEFIGKALGIPPLRDKINSLTGNLTEQEVIQFAEEFYNEYQDRYVNDKEKWYHIKNNHYDIHRETQAWRNNLKNLIKNYKKEEQ